jgi:hypothetical protein
MSSPAGIWAGRASSLRGTLCGEMTSTRAVGPPDALVNSVKAVSVMVGSWDSDKPCLQ